MTEPWSKSELGQIRTLPSGATVEVALAPSPLRPGERGQHTNGKAVQWLRINQGQWHAVPEQRDGRTVYLALDVCDSGDDVLFAIKELL